jgi:anthranilate phosphoribosyltransferase
MTESDANPFTAESYRIVLQRLLARQELCAEEVRAVLQALMQGELAEIEAAAVLTAWRSKGETASELATAAQVLRNAMIKLEADQSKLVDICGTGGDGAGTFNISTATALTVAGTGVRVAKHGNRAVTSRSGASDALTALGVRLQPGTSWPQRTLESAGLAFCFAPEFHPALARVGPLRKRLGIRTIFNCLGPLANPAEAAYQVIGVGGRELLEPMAGALAQLGIEHGFVVVGEDGLDEVTLTGPTRVLEIVRGNIQQMVWHPADFGLPACRLEDLAARDPEQSAAIIKRILDGVPGPCMNIVLANAATALLAAGRVHNLREGVTAALQAINSGKARHVLEKLCAD